MRPDEGGEPPPLAQGDNSGTASDGATVTETGGSVFHSPAEFPALYARAREDASSHLAALRAWDPPLITGVPLDIAESWRSQLAVYELAAPGPRRQPLARDTHSGRAAECERRDGALSIEGARVANRKARKAAARTASKQRTGARRTAGVGIAGLLAAVRPDQEAA